MLKSIFNFAHSAAESEGGQYLMKIMNPAWIFLITFFLAGYSALPQITTIPLPGFESHKRVRTVKIKSLPHKKVFLNFGSENETLPVTYVLPRYYNKTSKDVRKFPVILSLAGGSGDAGIVENNLMFWEQEAYKQGYILICPEIMGTSLRKNASRFVEIIFEWMDKELNYDRDRVVLTGISNGGLGAFYIAIADPQRFRALIVLPGGYSGPENDLLKLKDKPIRMLVGEKDIAWLELARKNHSALSAAKGCVTLNILPGQGHNLRINLKDIFLWIRQNINK